MDKYERRRLRLLHLRDSACGGSVARLSEILQKDPSYVARMLYPEGKAGKKRIGGDMVEHVELKFSLPRGWLDEIHETPKINEPIITYQSNMAARLAALPPQSQRMVEQLIAELERLLAAKPTPYEHGREVGKALGDILKNRIKKTRKTG